MESKINLEHLLIDIHFKGKVIDEKFGNSGKVYIVENEPHTIPEKYAIKTIKNVTEENFNHFHQEMSKWFHSKNSYLVTPHYAKYINGVPHICMPFLDGDLKNFMLNNSINEITALVFSLQITKGLLNLKKYKIHHHQDLNPPNILILDLSKKLHDFDRHIPNETFKYWLKVSDLGNANLKFEFGEGGRQGGKHPYKSPEQYRKYKYTDFEPDIFALGVMLYMFMTNEHPSGNLASKVLEDYEKIGDGSYWKDWACSDKNYTKIKNTALKKLLESMTSENPGERPSLVFIYKTLINQLTILSSCSADYLLFLFDYFDNYDLQTERKIKTF